MFRSRVGIFARGSAAPVVAFCVGSSRRAGARGGVERERQAVEDAARAGTTDVPLHGTVLVPLAAVTVPTPPCRTPTPSHHCAQSFEMSSSRKNAVCGRSSSPA